MSVTNSPTPTLSNLSNLSEESGQNKNDTGNYFYSTNISKQTQSFEISDGISFYYFF